MSSAVELEGLQTEARNSSSSDISQVSTRELCRIINNEDATIASAVEKCLPIIAEAVDAVTNRVLRGGRLIYVGAGTSGRLGVLDASEIPPTYSASSAQFVSLIAGGDVALRYAQEGAEDDIVAAENDLKALNLNPGLDSLVGIAASGRTPYVLRCLQYAKALGCTTIGLSCCDPSAMRTEGNIDHMISMVTGPEVVTGSTRMKAGTATKLVLNMLSTGVMIKCGKTYGNMMVDVKSTNIKLQQRARNMIQTICGSLSPSSSNELDALLQECDGSVKLAVATILRQTSVAEARGLLNEAGGVLSTVLTDSKGAIPGLADESGEARGHYVLGIDGGGSKCAVVLLGESGETGRGEAGGCNVTSVGVDNAITSISLAIQRAVDACPTLKGRPFHSIPFATIWAGLAGYENPNIAARVNSAFSKLFNRSVGESLRISSDIELLVTATSNHSHLDSVVVLVAGTGSAAMSYVRDGDHFRRTGRSGGWGRLLGDDGSGYSIGRQALRIALESADELNIRNQSGRSPGIVDPLAKQIFQHFGLDVREKQINLLSEILSPNSSKIQSDTLTTRRIAEVARLVVDASPSNDRAKDIIESGARSLFRTLSLLITSQGLDMSRSVLILAGGLMQSDTYRNTFRKYLDSSDIAPCSVQEVSQPALVAAQYLLQTLWR